MALLSLTGAIGCGDPAPTEDAADIVADSAEVATPEIPEPVESGLHLSVFDSASQTTGGLAVTHVKTVTPCPQPLGFIEARNDSASPAEVRVDIPLALQVEGPAGAPYRVESGASLEIPLSFTCKLLFQQKGTIEVTMVNGASSTRLSVPVTIVVRPAPRGACDTDVNHTIIDHGPEPDPGSVALTVWPACAAGGAADEAAVHACIADGVVSHSGVTADCADCYADHALCAAAECPEVCPWEPGACADCRQSAGCTATFFECAGLDQLDPCEDHLCESPPPPTCGAGTARRYSPFGECTPELTGRRCDYPVAVSTDCGGPSDCVDGDCKVAPGQYTYAPTVQYVTTARHAPYKGYSYSIAKMEAELTERLGPEFNIDPTRLLDLPGSALLLEFPGLESLSDQPFVVIHPLGGRPSAGSPPPESGLGTFEVGQGSFSASTGAPRLTLVGRLEHHYLETGKSYDAYDLILEARVVESFDGGGPKLRVGVARGHVPLETYARLLNESLARCTCLNLPPGAAFVEAFPKPDLNPWIGCTDAFRDAPHGCVTGVDLPGCLAIQADPGGACTVLSVNTLTDWFADDGPVDALFFNFEFEAVSASVVGEY
ncbi:MAG: hypothetical protein H6744_01215 [Deltaproteobacteria bacterium]|nr:hypothetical protein [Deltaproteobacteria bacterium]